ncbi:MAG TPA: CPBP family glutamic-type intramembrane protease [Candidatus Paceibacterota bacterium]|nr:CPBP family glutamic-type intramembrane protease [Candidatus Paceibacterota bacterium]
MLLDEIYLPQVYFVGFWKSFLVKGLRNFFFVAVVSAGEEVIWRILPLTFIVWLKNKIQKEDLGDLILLSIISLSSYCFGLSHAVPFNVLIQGVFGLIWNFLFLKTGGYQKRYFQASLYVIVSHLLYNALTLANGYFFVHLNDGVI